MLFSCSSKYIPTNINRTKDYDFSRYKSITVKSKSSKYKTFKDGYISGKSFYGKKGKNGEKSILLKKIKSFEFKSESVTNDVGVHFYPRKIKSTLRNMNGCGIRANSKGRISSFDFGFRYRIKENLDEWQDISREGAWEWLFGKQYKKGQIRKSVVFNFNKLQVKENQGMCDSNKIDDPHNGISFNISKKRISLGDTPIDRFNVSCNKITDVDFTEDLWVDVDLLGRIVGFKYERVKLQPNGSEPLRYEFSCSDELSKGEISIPKSWFGF